MAIYYLVIVVSVFVLLSISSGSFNSECLGGGGGGGQSYPCLYPALLVVLFLLAFLSVSLSLHSVLFGGSAHVTACGRVISHTIVNRW